MSTLPVLAAEGIEVRTLSVTVDRLEQAGATRGVVVAVIAESLPPTQLGRADERLLTDRIARALWRRAPVEIDQLRIATADTPLEPTVLDAAELGRRFGPRPTGLVTITEAQLAAARPHS